MTIKEIGNLPCKIGRTTITVYNAETGKTCGIIRNVYVAGKDNVPRRILEFRQKHNNLPLNMRMHSIEVDSVGYYIVDVGMHQRNLNPTDSIDRAVRIYDETMAASKYGLEVLELNLV